MKKSSNNLKSDFSEETVKRLNEFQNIEFYHPYTCDRNSPNCQVKENDGALIATTEGWICPCGDYKQNWHH